MITNLRELEKIVGNIIYKESGLTKDRIINAMSVRGPQLSKLITDKVKLSYDLNDVAIIFEITNRNNDDVNFSEEINEDEIRNNLALKVSIICYGNASNNVVNILRARLLSERVRLEFLENDVYIAEVSSATSLNEFINETVWPRTDFTINIDVEMLVKKTIADEPIDKVKSMDVYPTGITIV